jgi:hypothetical protein
MRNIGRHLAVFVGISCGVFECAEAPRVHRDCRDCSKALVGVHVVNQPLQL